MNSLTKIGDTIVAIATPPGIGALGVIRISGPEAISIADKLFKGRTLANAASHTLHYGIWKDTDNTDIDEVVISLYKTPKSFTGEHIVEISCHGSPYILTRCVSSILRSGARQAEPGEFTLRAFLNGKMDLSQAEAVADLISASHAKSHQLALSQLRGGISDQVKGLRESLIHFTSLIELELDFSEEDVEFADRSSLLILLDKTLGTISSLIQSFTVGNAIKNGISTVIAGRPNAGKSTLLNTLLREDRAIVSDIAGTTRDTIEEEIDINGVGFRLIDTAGIREATDQIEAIGVQRTLTKIDESPILVFVCDGSVQTPAEVEQDLRQLNREGLRILLLVNKIDIIPDFDIDGYLFDFVDVVIPVSAMLETNIDKLKNELYTLGISQEGNISDVVLTSIRHMDALQKTFESLSDARTGIISGITHDFVAMDLRRAMTYLGTIVGEIGTDDLLESIFTRFCIGK